MQQLGKIVPQILYLNGYHCVTQISLSAHTVSLAACPVQCAYTADIIREIMRLDVSKETKTTPAANIR